MVSTPEAEAELVSAPERANGVGYGIEEVRAYPRDHAVLEGIVPKRKVFVHICPA
jgi:hypothetical protein